MPGPAKRRATYADLLELPENVAGEILDGELYTEPRPGAPHATASSVLGGQLYPLHRGKGGPGGWVILDQPELHLHGHVLVPDLAGWRRERMPEIPDAAAFELAPARVVLGGRGARPRGALRGARARSGRALGALKRQGTTRTNAKS